MALNQTLMIRKFDARHIPELTSIFEHTDTETQLPQRVGDDGARQHVLNRGFLAVAGIRILQTVAGVLHLHLGEVLGRRTVEVHPAAG